MSRSERPGAGASLPYRWDGAVLGRGTQDSERSTQDPVGARRSYLSEAAAPMDIGAATSQRRPSPLVVSWDGLSAGRVRSTQAREAGLPTGTPGVATVAGGRKGIGERTLSAQPGATAPAGKGQVGPRPSEFERAYVFGPVVWRWRSLPRFLRLGLRSHDHAASRADGSKMAEGVAAAGCHLGPIRPTGCVVVTSKS